MSKWIERIRKSVIGVENRLKGFSPDLKVKPANPEISCDVLFVVAHQDAVFRRQIAQGLSNKVESFQLDKKLEIVMPENANELFHTAALGVNGTEAKLIFLGSQYFFNRESWIPDRKQLAMIAIQNKVDYLPFTKNRKVDDPSSKVIEKLYEPSGINFVLLLRAIGFKGNIMLEQSFPDFDSEKAEIMRRVEELHSVNPSFPLDFPVGGFFNAKQAEGRISMN